MLMKNQQQKKKIIKSFPVTLENSDGEKSFFTQIPFSPDFALLNIILNQFKFTDEEKQRFNYFAAVDTV